MKIIELVIDELDEDAGIDAISIVEYPAIEEDFVALNKSKEYKFQEVDSEKRLLTGALLVPNKPIYRRDNEEEYYIIFSKDTIRKASELYLMRGKQNRATYEHFKPIDGLTLVESWLVTDKENDKSNSYGMDLPVGTWMGTVKVNNDQVWEEFVKTGMVKGFSIEGFFSEKENETKTEIEAGLKLLEIKKLLIENSSRTKSVKKMDLESFSDYPDAVKNNAKRGLELNKKVNNKCATQVGKVRAQQLAQGKPISMETIKRMYSYLSRAEEYYNPSDTEACGTISYLLWGGKSAKSWAESKIKQNG